MIRSTILLSIVVTAASPSSQPPSPKPPALPVREVTVFKDGHALVVHRGAAATDQSGNVVLADLPQPVLGTFWAFSGDARASLRAVASGPRVVSVERDALDVRSLIEANPGAEVIVTESGHSYAARIEGVPRAGGTGATPATISDIALLRTQDGVRVVPLAQITEVTFRGEFRHVLARESVDDRLTLRLDWRGAAPAATAEVGMMYVQKGLRWIPGYKITLDGAGQADVEMQATLINELIALDHVTANFVVGVPRFLFQDTIDPIALQKAAAQLSPLFQSGSQTGYALSNAMMSQVARMTELRNVAPSGGDAPAGAPDLASERAEDQFVYTLEDVTLGKGECMVVPVARFKLRYEDVHRLVLPASPPQEAWQQFDAQRQSELAALLNAPKVMHAVRLRNDSAFPVTTAPVLLLRDGRVLAQGMTTYTAIGASLDLDVVAAIDVRVKTEENETGRVPSAERWRNETFLRVDLAGRIELDSAATKPIRLEVVRHVLGAVDAAGQDGRIVQRSTFELSERELGGSATSGTPWWRAWSWPWWWHRFNGVGRITWDVALAPGQKVELDYRWHYIAQ